MKDIKRLITFTKPVIALVIALTMVLALGAVPAQARAIVHKDASEFPVEWISWVPCAAGGAGEEVHVTGTFRIVSQTTIDERGGLHGKYQIFSKGLQGVGLTTGDKYQGKYIFQDRFNSWSTYTHTYGDKVKLTGEGPGNNLASSFRIHMTVNAQGEVTAYIDTWSWECK
ncbi:MAG TPA: hypothetical protein VFY25_10235 [Anaerolineales bacterium]|nr:hypothetical protein [Anaerolineales bacterium]